MHPPLVHAVEEAARVGRLRPEGHRGAVDDRRVAVERVEVDRDGHRRAVRRIDAQHVVHRLQHVAVADAQSLVGGLDAELVAVVRDVALLEEVEPLEVRPDTASPALDRRRTHRWDICAHRGRRSGCGARVGAWRKAAAPVVRARRVPPARRDRPVRRPVASLVSHCRRRSRSRAMVSRCVSAGGSASIQCEQRSRVLPSVLLQFRRALPRRRPTPPPAR